MVLVLDIGGTKIRVANVSKGKVTNKKTISTPKTREEILNSILKIISKYPKEKNIHIGVAGYVKNGFLLKTPNLDLNEFDFKKWFESKHKSKIIIENDAKCAAMAELEFGQAKNYKNSIFLTIGTGIGGAIIINKKIYLGNGFAGEIGHMMVDGDEFEKISSGKALNILAQEAYSPLRGPDISKSAEAGNAMSLRIFEVLIENLSTGILNLVHILDPEAIIIGGSFSNISFLPNKLSIAVNEKDSLHRGFKIVNSKLGDDAVLIGASLL